MKQKMKEKIEKNIKIVFISFFILICLFYFVKVFLVGFDARNEVENRVAYKAPKFSIQTFINKTYQEQLEKAVEDQVLFSSTLKKKSIDYHNNLVNIMLNPFRKDDNYNLVAKDMYTFGESDYLLYKHEQNKLTKKQLQVMKNLGNQYDKIKIKNKYLYLVNNDCSIDFTNINNKLFEKLDENFLTFKKGYLEIDSYETYKKYFYKNDHHWNYEGSYQGYKDIMNLMLKSKDKKEIIKPIGEIDLNAKVKGSKNWRSGYKISDENFIAYDFAIPEHKTLINNSYKNYGLQTQILKTKKYNKKKITYGEYYGGDYREIIFDYNNSKKENLLIIGFSDTNAINELIASHYNKTYVIDLRYYQNIELQNYINDNNIDNLLLIFNPKTFDSTEAYIEKAGDK